MIESVPYTYIKVQDKFRILFSRHRVLIFYKRIRIGKSIFM